MLILQLLGAIGQFERSLIKARQREGIAIARARGVYKGIRGASQCSTGTPPGRLRTRQIREMAARGVPKVDIAQTLGISRASVYEYLKA